MMLLMMMMMMMMMVVVIDCCLRQERDVLERHLLRLGSGVERLAEFTGGRDFSKFGRVNFTLSRRQELLTEVRASSVEYVTTSMRLHLTSM